MNSLKKGLWPLYLHFQVVCKPCNYLPEKGLGYYFYAEYNTDHSANSDSPAHELCMR